MVPAVALSAAGTMSSCVNRGCSVEWYVLSIASLLLFLAGVVVGALLVPRRCRSADRLTTVPELDGISHDWDAALVQLVEELGR